MAIEMIKETTDDMNCSVQMYKNNSYTDKPYTVRLVDLDANETVSCVICPTVEIAKNAYAKMIG